jgi:predicted lipoprotein with Yx(FWY)xxD motif
MQVAAAGVVSNEEWQMSPMQARMQVGSCLALAAMLVACARSERPADTLQSSGAVAESTPNPSASGAAATGGRYDSAGAATTAGAIATATATKVGTYLTDANGRALYMFEKDRANASSCSGDCAAAWPPFIASTPATNAAGVSAAKLGTIKRGDGTTQVTYAGMPLYHYHDDAKPGDIKGQDKEEFGDSWYLVSPAGKKIEEHDK